MQTYTFDYNIYKKKIRKRKNHSFLIMFLVIIVLIVACAFILPKQTINTYYFIRINTYLTYKEANTMASELQSKCAAGYIHFDGKYHVLASFYPSEQEAVKVLNNLSTSYPNADIYTLETAQIKRSTNDIILDSVECQINTINQLYNLIIGLDTNQLSQSQFTTSLSNLKKDFDDTKSNFQSYYKASKQANIITAYDKLESIASSLENIAKITPQANCFQFKYELIDIVFNHLSFLDSL